MEQITTADLKHVDQAWQKLVSEASHAARNARNEGSNNSSYPSTLETFEKAVRSNVIFFKSV